MGLPDDLTRTVTLSLGPEKGKETHQRQTEGSRLITAEELLRQNSEKGLGQCVIYSARGGRETLLLK